MGGWQTKFNVSPGPGLWPLVLGPFGPDLGPDLDLTWDLDLDLSLTINKEGFVIPNKQPRLGSAADRLNSSLAVLVMMSWSWSPELLV